MVVIYSMKREALEANGGVKREGVTDASFVTFKIDRMVFLFLCSQNKSIEAYHFQIFMQLQ